MTCSAALNSESSEKPGWGNSSCAGTKGPESTGSESLSGSALISSIKVLLGLVEVASSFRVEAGVADSADVMGSVQALDGSVNESSVGEFSGAMSRVVGMSRLGFDSPLMGFWNSVEGVDSCAAAFSEAGSCLTAGVPFGGFGNNEERRATLAAGTLGGGTNAATPVGCEFAFAAGEGWIVAGGADCPSEQSYRQAEHVQRWQRAAPAQQPPHSKPIVAAISRSVPRKRLANRTGFVFMRYPFAKQSRGCAHSAPIAKMDWASSLGIGRARS